MNPAPSLQGALWSGNQQLATKKQLLSSISGLYTDIQDINLSTVNVTTISASTFNGSFVSLSTLQLKALDIGGLNFSFDLGLGDALGGALAGLGAAVGGAFVGVGTGVGLAVQGLETGLATLINGRGENFINNQYFETVNGTTQLQISTLGNAFPLYSSIQRVVSSISPNEVPGQQIFVSSFFLPGTTCIRSVSDPLSIITGDSNIASSTIQSFGQWTPFLDPSVTGEDIFARDAQFSTLTVSSSNNNTLGAFSGVARIENIENPFNPVTLSLQAQSPNISNSYNVPYSEGALSQVTSNKSIINNTGFDMTLNFISTPYNQYTSTIGTYNTPVFFLTSSITNQSTIPKFIYTGADFGGANFAVCEPDETGFLSTGTMDLVAQSSNITFQWGLAVNNLNSTIAFGTSKRVSWDIPGAFSNFIDIPVPQSTIVGGRSNAYALLVKPNELEFVVQDQTPFYQGFPYRPIAFNINGACFGSNTAWSNQPGYPYQINGNTFINGILEADTLIAISSIVNVSTNIQTFFSTQTFDADEATISSLTVTSFITFPTQPVTTADFIQLTASNALISSLQTNFIGGDQISSFGIETYTNLCQFQYVSTLVVDFQILEGTTGGTTTNLNKIQGTTAGSFVRNYTLGSFSNLSTNNLSCGTLFANNPTFSTINLSTIQEIGLTNIFNYPGAITAIAGNNAAPFVASGFKAQLSTSTDAQTRIDYNYNQITATSNGSAFYPLATFDPTQPVPYVWDIGNIQNAIMSNATIDNAYISTLNLSSINSSNASYSNVVVGNLQVSTINNENSSTMLQYLSMPNSDGATTGSPGVWLQWIDLSPIRQNIRNCPSLDLNIGCIAMGADNAPNGGMTGYIGVREKGQGNPLTYKVVENRTIYAGSGTPALYGGDITFALQKGIDYSANASTMTIWIYGAANNPYFRTGGYASNAFIRGYPY